MRCEGIEIEMKIPAPFLQPDGNDVFYTEEAIINAVKNTNCLPVTQYNDKGIEVVIGNTESIRYENGYIYCKGIIYTGGFTSENVELTNYVVTKCDFSSVGFDIP
jgi:hypothetical protein